MWYSILKRELTLQNKFDGAPYVVKAGSIFRVEKYNVYGEVGVRATGVYDDTNVLILRTEEARALMTKPSRDYDDVHEEAIMICEGAYC